MLRAVKLSEFLSANNRAADFDQNLSVITVPEVLCQRLKNNGVFDLIEQFSVDFGSKPFALNGAQEHVAAARLHPQCTGHPAFVKNAASVFENVTIKIQVTDQHLALMRGLGQIAGFSEGLHLFAASLAAQ